MNARQKAKHFKKLYEELLYRQPHKYQYRMEIDKDFAQDHKPEIEAQIEHRMLQIISPYILNNLKVEKDLIADKYILSLDFWI
ncbi:MAG: hypothetical protein IKO76_06670 [Butyrivibrio sp.]|nr:hypothetical protein [Butyrivibrio sp.]